MSLGPILDRDRYFSYFQQTVSAHMASPKITINTERAHIGGWLNTHFKLKTKIFTHFGPWFIQEGPI